MSLSSESMNELLDLYDDLLRELGVKYIGRAYRDNTNYRVPIAINDVLCWIDLDTQKAIEEEKINQDNLILVGCFIYDKTDFLEMKKVIDERYEYGYVDWPGYYRDMYDAELLTMASIKMHMIHPEEVERIWVEIGKKYGLNKRQSHALRIACYQPSRPFMLEDYEDEDGDYDSDADEWLWDRSKIIEESNLGSFLEDLAEYSNHCFCKPYECKIDESRIDRCRELHARFDNGGMLEYHT